MRQPFTQRPVGVGFSPQTQRIRCFPASHHHHHPLSGALLLLDASIPLAWQATDADGDTLLFSLFYSPDDGLTWLDLALEQTDSTYQLALRPRGARQQVKVIVTDGLRSREAVVRFGVFQRLFLPEIRR